MIVSPQPVFQSPLENPYITLIISAAVSLDVIALTFCSANIYLSGSRTWIRWAKYNAGWHAGLLLTYLVVIDVLSAGFQCVAFLLYTKLPPWLHWLTPTWTWIADRFRSHIVIYVAIMAMAFVWYQYSKKVCSNPTEPRVDESPIFLRSFFTRRISELSNPNSRWYWHLSACLVAVDMLALAAVIKSGEKLVKFPDGFEDGKGSFSDLLEKMGQTFKLDYLVSHLTATTIVFIVVGLLCFISAKISQVFWSKLDRDQDNSQKVLEANFIIVALKLFEPMVIFYFIIHSMAFLVTGVPLHSPAFILGSGFLVAALIQYVGFQKILESASKQVAQSASSTPGISK